MSSREASPSPPIAGAKDTEPKKEKRFNNGWSHEQEELMAKWADISSCYRWMHDRAEKSFYKKNLSITVPVIILSTLTGTANFGISSIFGTDDYGKNIASFVIGGISIIAGVMTTLGNFLRYPQLNESHRVCGISWGKLQRQIAVELSLHPNDRQDSMDFIKICRTELDRLIEQSPVIPDSIIAEFQEIFGDNEELEKPEIVGDIDHTTVFRDNRTRLMDIATNAALMIRHKKNLLKEIVTEDLNKQIADEVQRRLSDTKREIREKVSALSVGSPRDTKITLGTPNGSIGPKLETSFVEGTVSTSEHTLKPVNTIETSDRVYGKI